MDYSSLTITATIAVFIVGCMLLAGYVVHLLEQKRTKRILDVAPTLGFDYIPQADPNFSEELSRLSLFTFGGRKALWNLLRGIRDNTDIAIFDYRYVTGSGKHQKTYTQTAVWLRFDGRPLPDFALRPETFSDNLCLWSWPEDFDFHSHPDFSQLFLLRGANEQAVRAVFTDAVLKLFEQTPGVSTEASDNMLLFYRHGIRVAPECLESLLNESLRVVDVFTDSGKRERKQQARSATTASRSSVANVATPSSAQQTSASQRLSGRLLKLAFGILWFGLITTAVTVLRLLIGGVTTLDYSRTDVFASGVCLGLIVALALWWLSGRHLITSDDGSEPFARQRGFALLPYVLVPCSLLLLFTLNFDMALCLDAQGITAKSLFASREVRFDQVRDLILSEVHGVDSKGHPTLSYSADFRLKPGGTVEWPASELFQIERELREILQRREIALIDNAPVERPMS